MKFKTEIGKLPFGSVFSFKEKGEPNRMVVCSAVPEADPERVYYVGVGEGMRKGMEYSTERDKVVWAKGGIKKVGELRTGQEFRLSAKEENWVVCKDIHNVRATDCRIVRRDNKVGQFHNSTKVVVPI